MASLQEVKDDIADLGTQVAAEIQAVSDKISQLQQNGGASAADLDDLKTSIDAVKKTITDETAALSGNPNP